MKKLHFFYLLLTFLAFTIYACEREVLAPQEFTEAHFAGKWPLKVHIEIATKNGVITSNDTVKLSPIDTLTYTADGKYIRKTDTVGYTIDANGENISYATKPSPTVWQIKWLRVKSIILSQERTVKTGADTFVYYTEEQLIK